MPDSGESVSLRLRALGRDLVLVAPPEYAATLAADWARCLAPEAARGDEADTVVVLDPAAGPTAYRYAAQTQVTLAAIMAATGQLLMWHAAGLATPEGRVLALLAPSGTGKTTAAAHLGSSGYGYVTDETVGVTLDGRVLPYPKPLALRTADPVKDSLGPDALDLGSMPMQARLHRLVRLDRLPREPGDVQRARMEPYPPLDAVLELVALSSGLTQLPDPLAALARTLDATGGLVAVRYTDITAARPLLDDLMAGPVPFPDATDWQWEHLGVDDGSVIAPVDADPSGPLVWRGDYLDAIATPDEILLLVGPVPVRLSGIGATLWLALDRGRTEAELVERLQQVHGPHPQADEIVAQTVAELVGHGVLVKGHPGGGP